MPGEKTYGTIVTTKGAELIAACILNGEKLKISEAAAGDGNGAYYVPSLDQEALLHELWRGEIASAELNASTPNMLDVKIVIDDSVGNFIVREMGLFSEDGDLIAVCNTPDTEKVAISTGVSGQLTMVMHIVVADASVVEFTISPSLDTVSKEDLENAISKHNTDKNAHPDIRASLTDLDTRLKAAAKTAGDAADAADKALKAITKLTNTISTVPSQNGTLTYNGGNQTPTWNNYNPDALDLGGVTEGKDAGEYEATFTPKEGFTWSDESSEAKKVKWYINRATIAVEPSQTGTLTYDGEPKTPSWTGYDEDKMTLGGTTTATEAGQHTAEFTPTKNYQWSNGSSDKKDILWTIGRATITATPTQRGTLTYTGEVLTPSWNDYDPDKLTLGGQPTGTTAGRYEATFTPTKNYQWSGGSITAKTVAWNIGKAAGSLSIDKPNLTLNAKTKSGTIKVTRAGNGTITASASPDSVASVSVAGDEVTVTGKSYGVASVTIKVGEGTNHLAPAEGKTCSVTVNIFTGDIKSNSWAAIRAASAAGEAASTWAVGDTKPITLNGKVGNFNFSSFSIDVFIIGFNHNASREGNNKTHWQIGKINGNMVGLCDTKYGSYTSDSGYFNMNPNNSNTGGWKESYRRKTLYGNDDTHTPTNPLPNSLMAALPADLRAVMQPVTKYTDNKGNHSSSSQGVDSDISTTTDYLFDLAEFEVQEKRTYANQYEQNYQERYAYYKAGNTKIAYRHDSTSSAVWWFGRSPCYFNCYFTLTYTDGSPTYDFAYFSSALLPGFST